MADSQPIVNIDKTSAGKSIMVDVSVTNNYSEASSELKELKLEDGQLIWNVPHFRNENFTGREDILLQLRDSLQKGTTTLSQKTSSQNTARAIHGLGGIGKTQTAIEYCYRSRFEDDYPNYKLIWWVDAETAEGLLSDLGSLAFKLRLVESLESEVQIAHAMRWLEEKQDWLLVFDNVEHPDAIKPYLPKTENGQVLITSRYREWKSVTENDIKIDVWSEKEALDFIRKQLGEDVATQSLKELSNELGRLPLALAHAAAYIQTEDMGIGEYLELYTEYRKDLNLTENQLKSYDKSVATAIGLSIKHLKDTGNENALKVLYHCAQLAPEGIPIALFTEHTEALDDNLAEEVSNPIKANALWKSLTNISLVEKQKNTLFIHRVVQAVVLDSLSKDKTKEVYNFSLALLRHAFQFRDNDLKTWPIATSYAEHVSHFCNYANTTSFPEEEQSRLCDRLANYYVTVPALYLLSEQYYQQAIEIDKKTIGEEHPSYAIRLNNLAALYRQMGRYEEAEPLYTQAIEIDKKTIGEEHPSYAISLNNLAGLYEATNRLDQAEPLRLQDLEITKNTKGVDHPEYAISLNNLAGLYFQTDRVLEAKPLLEQAHAIFESTLGAEHPHTQQLAETLKMFDIAALMQKLESES